MTTPAIRRYVALGDSLSEGYSDWGRADRAIGFASLLAGLLREQAPDLEWTNFGRSGTRVPDVLRDQVDPAIALAPDLVTLVVGANDITGALPAQFRRDYSEVVGRLRSQIPGIVVVANIPDFVHLLPTQYASYRAAIRGRTDEFNRAIADTAAAHGALLADLAGSREAEDPRNLSGDGVHPNARGYRAMVRVFVATLNTAGLSLPLPELDA